MIKIALAEDNSFLIHSLLEKLSFFDDVQVKFTSENGIELLEQLKKDANIDIVLMDIQMPEMNGIEATRLVKEKYPNIKILMLTVFDDEHSLFNSIKAGANGYILKETDPKALYSSIKELMKGGAPMSPTIAVKALGLLKNPDKVLVAREQQEAIKISTRHKEILELIIKGFDYNKIAKNLFIAPSTVRKHIENIYKKLEVHSKIEAIEKAKTHGLI